MMVDGTCRCGLLLLVLLAGSAASTAAHSQKGPHLRRPQSLAQSISRQLKQQANINPYYHPRPLPPHADEAVKSLQADDILVTALPSLDSGYTVWVLDNTTLQVKGSLSKYLSNVCPFGVSSSVAVSPKARHLAFTCPISRRDDQRVDLNTRTLNVDHVSDLPPAIHPGGSLLYNRSGALLVSAFNSSRIRPILSVVLDYQKPLADAYIQHNLTSTTFGAITGMDLSDDGSTLLYTNHGPDILTYDMEQTREGPVYGTIPDANCTAVIALYGGDAIVGCADADQTTSRYCAYLLGKRDAELDGVRVIKRRWCAPDAEDLVKRACAPQVITAVSLAMDVDRRHFYLSFVGTDLPHAFPTLYKIRYSDFKAVANSSRGLDIMGMTVFGAVPANQQDCPMNYGRCCTPSGRPVALGTVCYTSTDPCSSDSVCDGEEVNCPTHTTAENGSPCSFEPFGLFQPAYSYADWKGKLGITQEDADRDGLHKCYGCSYGFCVPLLGKKRHGRGLHARGSHHTGWTYCH